MKLAKYIQKYRTKFPIEQKKKLEKKEAKP